MTQRFNLSRTGGVILFVSAALIALGVVATPAPAAAAPLKEIIHVHSSAFCTAVRNNLAGGIAGLHANDQVILHSAHLEDKMGRDAGFGHDGMVGMDEARLENDVDAIVRNLALVDSLVSDSSRFSDPTSPEADRLRELREKVNKVEDRQRVLLNVVNGNLETKQLSELFNAYDKNMAAAVLPDGGKSLEGSGAFTHGKYDEMFATPTAQLIGASESNLRRSEDSLSTSVLDAVNECAAQQVH